MTNSSPKPWWFAGIALLIIGGTIACSSNKPASNEAAVPAGTTSTPAPEQKTSKSAPTVSKQEFDTIQSEMTLEQVTEIIGGPGELMSESGKKGENLHVAAYSYKGEGSEGATVTLIFVNNKLQNKTQVGLK